MSQKSQTDGDKRRQEIEDLRAVVGSQNGARFVWKLLGECGVFRLSFHQSGSQTMFNEGMRNVGLNLMKDLTEASPEFVPNMMLKMNKENS